LTSDKNDYVQLNPPGTATAALARTGPERLPWIAPSESNGYKLDRFRSPARGRDAPVKNALGSESPDSARRARCIELDRSVIDGPEEAARPAARERAAGPVVRVGPGVPA
jgi:hypothetical protein